MDDVAGGKEARQPNGQHKEARRKYMDMLQKVADRELDEVTIELDDLDNVCDVEHPIVHGLRLTLIAVREEPGR